MIKRPVIKRPKWDSPNWELPRRAKPPTLREYEQQLLTIFFSITRDYGMKKARQAFANFVREANKTELKNYEMFEMLQYLASMNPRPNVKRLVREMLAEKGIGPDHRKFQKEAEALDRKIRNWRKKHWPGIKAKFGAVSPPPPAHDEPVRFVIHKIKKQK
jgi:hypothetical protein